jgi:hypothetical protein
VLRRQEGAFRPDDRLQLTHVVDPADVLPLFTMAETFSTCTRIRVCKNATIDAQRSRAISFHRSEPAEVAQVDFLLDIGPTLWSI